MVNEELCWKCRALLGSELCDGVKYHESQTTLPGYGPSFKRTLQTTEGPAVTALLGCSLCSRVLASLNSGVEPCTPTRQKGQGAPRSFNYSVTFINPQVPDLSLELEGESQGPEGDRRFGCYINLHPDTGG